MNLIKTIKHIITVIFKIPYYGLRHNRINVTSEIGNNTFLKNCMIGKWCFVGGNGTFNNVEIGNYTCIAPSCQIGGMEHSYWKGSISPKLSDECISNKMTYVGHDVWIAANCIIKQGVSIGDGAVIGAHSFVNQDIPPYAIAFGSPAKIYKYRFDEETINRLNQSNYWKHKPEEAKQILSQISIKQL